MSVEWEDDESLNKLLKVSVAGGATILEKLEK